MQACRTSYRTGILPEPLVPGITSPALLVGWLVFLQAHLDANTGRDHATKPQRARARGQLGSSEGGVSPIITDSSAQSGFSWMMSVSGTSWRLKPLNPVE